MPKAYWIANVTVLDPEKYAGYQSLAPEAFARYGAQFLACGAADTLEGRDWQRRVVIEFDSLDAAHACYHSAEYQTAKARRDGACEADIAIIEGLE